MPQEKETGFGFQEKREIHLDVGLERFGLNSSYPPRQTGEELACRPAT